MNPMDGLPAPPTWRVAEPTISVASPDEGDPLHQRKTSEVSLASSVESQGFSYEDEITIAPKRIKRIPVFESHEAAQSSSLLNNGSKELQNAVLYRVSGDPYITVVQTNREIEYFYIPRQKPFAPSRTGCGALKREYGGSYPPVPSCSSSFFKSRRSPAPPLSPPHQMISAKMSPQGREEAPLTPLDPSEIRCPLVLPKSLRFKHHTASEVEEEETPSSDDPTPSPSSRLLRCISVESTWSGEHSFISSKGGSSMLLLKGEVQQENPPKRDSVDTSPLKKVEERVTPPPLRSKVASQMAMPHNEDGSERGLLPPLTASHTAKNHDEEQ